MKLLLCLLCLLQLQGCSLTYEKGAAKQIIAVFAHPDDETWVAGSLALLAKRGFVVTPVYITSGDRGDDRSGRQLTAKKLAKQREKEARNAAKALGLALPIFLNFPDGKSHQNQQMISDKLAAIILSKQPTVIFSFHHLGITGNRDHQVASSIVKNQVQQLQLNNLISFAISTQRATHFEQIAKSYSIPYQIKQAVNKLEIDFLIDVSDSKEQRKRAFSSHKTQFPEAMVSAFNEFINVDHVEELIVNDNQVLRLFIKNYLLID